MTRVCGGREPQISLRNDYMIIICCQKGHTKPLISATLASSAGMLALAELYILFLVWLITIFAYHMFL